MRGSERGFRSCKQRRGRYLLDERTVQQISVSGGELGDALNRRQRGIIRHALTLHLLEQRIRYFVPHGAVLDAVDARGERVSYVVTVAGVHHDRERLGVRFGGYCLEDRQIQAIENPAAGARL